MIKILIVDDDNDKVDRIRDAIHAIPEVRDNDVTIASDMIQARDACAKRLYDLLILDLKVPNRLGDTPQDLAGWELVKELNASTTLLKPFHIIGLTAYDDVFNKVDPFFEQELWRIIKYDPGANNWRRQLTAKLEYLVTSKKALIKTEQTRHIYDLGIVTALRVPEFQSVLDLPGDWEQTRQPNDATLYYRGHFRKDNRQLSVIAASSQQMGMTAAAVLSTKLISHFHPRYIATTGIAAAVNNDEAKPGDILIADQSWDYECGKRKLVNNKHVFEPSPRCISLHVGLREILMHSAAERSFLSDIEARWRGGKIPGRLELHIGPMASGAAVIQDGSIVENIRAHNRKLIGIDMELYGLFFAAENSPLPKPIPFSVKSVSDFADTGKSDEYQAYAAFTSAQFLYHFALEHLTQIAD